MESERRDRKRRKQQLPSPQVPHLASCYKTIRGDSDRFLEAGNHIYQDSYVKSSDAECLLLP